MSKYVTTCKTELYAMEEQQIPKNYKKLQKKNANMKKPPNHAFCVSPDLSLQAERQR